MANKKIVDLPASGALVSNTLCETELTAGGASQKATLAQLLTFIQNNATAFAQAAVAFGGAITVNDIISLTGGRFGIASDGSAFFATSALVIAANGTVTVGTLALITLSPDGSAAFANGLFAVDDLGAITAVDSILCTKDIEVTNNGFGVILKSANGTRYRLKVDNAGNLGTEAA